MISSLFAFFQKGSGHITFKRMDLVEKMNNIVAKHYPGCWQHSDLQL
jgi:hypothetical protein